MDNWVRIPIAAPRARRLTLPNFVEPRAGRCSCPGQSLLPFARSSLLRARIWEEPAPAQLERWWAASEQGDAASRSRWWAATLNTATNGALADTALAGISSAMILV